jgi:putative methyltransferase (TIGR04325 family)
MPSFESFTAASKQVKGGGYSGADLVSVVREKTERYRDSLASGYPRKLGPGEMSLLAAIALCAPAKRTAADGLPRIRVLDFGGACGRDFFTVNALFGGFLRFEWHVVETPEMASAARSLAGNGLSFYSSLPEAISGFSGRPDLLVSIGTLQYLPQPWETIQGFVDSGASCILLSRLVLNPGPADLFTIQKIRLSENGPGAVPAGFRDSISDVVLTLLSGQALERVLGTKYRLTQLEGSDEVFHGPGGKTFRYSGYLGVGLSQNQ